MPVILIATTNPGKLKEFARLFADVPDCRIVSPNEAEIWREVAETGDTFEENALLKARAFREALPDEALRDGWWVLADDSGLEVDALEGAPGVHSNRWAGPNTTADDRNRLLLKRMEGVPVGKRSARFRCVIAAISPRGDEILTEGAVEGRIAYEPRGSGGFGYDPLFEFADGRRLSELSPDEKNGISHRGVAGSKAAKVIANYE